MQTTSSWSHRTLHLTFASTRWIVKRLFKLEFASNAVWGRPSCRAYYWQHSMNFSESSCLQLPNVVCRRWRWPISSTSRGRDRCLRSRRPSVRGAPDSGWGVRSVQKLRHAAEKLLSRRQRLPKWPLIPSHVLLECNCKCKCNFLLSRDCEGINVYLYFTKPVEWKNEIVSPSFPHLEIQSESGSGSEITGKSEETASMTSKNFFSRVIY